MRTECRISSTDLWEFVDEEKSRSRIRLEELEKGKALPSLVEYGYQLALSKLMDYLITREEESEVDISKML